MLLAEPACLKLKGVAGHWLVQHTVRAKPDGRPRLGGTINSRQAAHSYVFLSTLHVMHTLTHTNQFPSSPWAGAMDHYKVSALRSRVGWTSARNNERFCAVD